MSTRRWIDERQSLFSRTNTRAQSLRETPSATEQRFWTLIRKVDGFRGGIRRQCPIGPYVVDFVHHGAKLAIELDGYFHENDEARAADGERDLWLRSQGFHVLRFRNEQVWKDTDAVIELLKAELAARAPSPQPLPHKGGGAFVSDSQETEL